MEIRREVRGATVIVVVRLSAEDWAALAAGGAVFVNAAKIGLVPGEAIGGVKVVAE